MPRHTAIRLCAGTAIAGGVAALLAALLLTAGMLLLTPDFPGPLPPLALRVGGILTGLVFAALAAWAIASGMGVLRRWPWARGSMLACGAVLALFGITGALGTLLTPLQTVTASDARLAYIVRVSLTTFYSLITLTGVWWLAVFTRASAKRYFAAASEERFPLSAGVIGWYLIAGGTGSAIVAVLGVPAPFFGWLVSGWHAAAMMTFWAGAQVYLGSAVLELDDAGRRWAIAFFIVAAANAASAGLFPAPVRALQLAAFRLFHIGFAAGDGSPGPAGAVLAAVAMAAPIWFLVLRRAAFRGER